MVSDGWRSGGGRRGLLLLLALLIIVASCTNRGNDRDEAARGVLDTPAPAAEATATRRPTAVPSPTSAPRVLVVCMAGDPTSLTRADSTYVTQNVLEAVQEPLIDARHYAYQPNLVEKLPSFADGDAVIREITIGEGSRFYDSLNDRVLDLSPTLTESFALAQLEGESLFVERWDGTPLTTVEVTATWRLVEGLRWEDGTPVTADDSRYAFEIARDPAWPGSHYKVDRTAAYRALDERAIEWRGLPGYTDGTYFLNVWEPQPRHAYDQRPVAELLDYEPFNRQPLSYGPFRIEEWTPGEIRLLPNPYYVNAPVGVERLVFLAVPDSRQLALQVANGECDIGTRDGAFEGSMGLLRSLAGDRAIVIHEVASTVFEHLDFNIQPVAEYGGEATFLLDPQGGRLFANPSFRHAVAYCLDRQAIVDQAFEGAGFVRHSYLAEEHPLFPGNEALVTYPFDPARGQALLDELGFVDTDGDGIRNDRSGNPLRFRHSTRQNPARERVTQIVQAQLREHCGIESRIELYGSDYFQNGPEGILFGRRYDVGQFAWLTGVEPPCALYTTQEIPNEVNGWGAANVTGFSDPQFDAACNGALRLLDEAQSREKHRAAVIRFTEMLPSIPLYARSRLTIARPDVIGIEVDPTSISELWNIERLTVER